MFTAAFEISQRSSQSALTYPTPAQTAGSAVGQELSQTGAQITRRNLNVQPTIKVPAGYKFTVRVNRDILFEAPYLERHFSVKEIADSWGLCENSVREIFKSEADVVRIQRPKSRWKRAYTTLRIPESVVERVHRRMSVVV
jgi:hypothetical protein